MKIIHVVRRYGPVGGMERYVWELTRELVALGHEVEVICERCYPGKPQGIAVHEIGEIAWRPRWFSLLRFGWRVADWLKNNPHPGWLIHSNERLALHHVTTFHGPPFATVRDMPWWRKISIRVLMQLYLERRELTTARTIVPNSTFIRERLAYYYPEYMHKLGEPVAPGVSAVTPREWKAAPADGGIIGFVGKEWQRKGLPLIVSIVAELQRTRPKLELWVVGPEPEEVRHLFEGWPGGYRLLGWNEQAPFAKFDVLLHPAKAEPYGMVISEAMSARVPVVVSDVCGAASQIGPAAGAVLPLSASVSSWVNAVEIQLQRTDVPPCFMRSWGEVAREYETIYRKISENIQP
jgi:UDP-glucose:(heptosyl)LPS alpha-1,3-glucosyltransferase